MRELDVVIKSVFDRRACGKLGLRPDLQDRGGEDVRAGMSDAFDFGHGSEKSNTERPASTEKKLLMEPPTNPGGQKAPLFLGLPAVCLGSGILISLCRSGGGDERGGCQAEEDCGHALVRL